MTCGYLREGIEENLGMRGRRHCYRDDSVKTGGDGILRQKMEKNKLHSLPATESQLASQSG